MFHDAQHIARTGFAHDPAIPGGVGNLRGQHSHGVTVSRVGFQDLRQGARVEQRHITGEHHDGAADGCHSVQVT